MKYLVKPFNLHFNLHEKRGIDGNMLGFEVKPKELPYLRPQNSKKIALGKQEHLCSDSKLHLKTFHFFSIGSSHYSKFMGEYCLICVLLRLYLLAIMMI